MKKRICIVELYDHHEVVRVLAKLFAGAGYDISIFCSQEVMANLGVLSAQFILKPNSESQKVFMRKQVPTLNKSNLILFTTLVKYPKFFSQLRFRPPTLLLIHDGNYFLRPNRYIQINGIKDSLRWIKFKLFREEKYRKQLLQHFTFVTFADDFIAQNLSKEIKALNIKVLPALPLSFHEAQPARLPSKKTTIVIPGSIKPIRDYNMVIRAFRQIEHLISEPTNIVLLGNGNTNFGRKIIAQFKKLENKNIKIIAQEAPFTQKSYDDYLAKASFAIIPIKKVFIGGIFMEEYGKTKITGSVNDVIRFGIPTLIRQSYPTNSYLFEAYQNFDECSTLILNWLGSKSTKELTQRSLAAHDYSFDNMTQKILNLEIYFSQK